ncbi:MAG TPA: hypothetical protein VL501_07255 [Pyrinomonadaceae bacterium]|nr:hypothetical protein [Pyrinomonadaceae bacterium]
MKWGLLAVIAVATGTLGCSSDTSHAANGPAKGSPTLPMVSNSNGLAAPANSNAAPLASNTGSSVPVPPGNFNSDQPVSTFNRRPPKGVLRPGPVLPPTFRTAGENSEYGLTMDPEGRPLEIRKFKGNAPITRVDATLLDPKTKLLKITLKGGKTVETRTDGKFSLQSATLAQLLQLSKAK